jgi:hypothetical protein
MSFKYINPGYAEFLDVAGGTTIADTIKSRTGVMFYQPTDKKGLELSETPAELYGKFDVYIPKNRNDFSIKIAMLETNGYALDGMGFVKRDNAMYFMRYYSGNSSGGADAYLSEPERLNLKLDAINTFYFHVKTGADGYVQIYANGQSVEKYDYDIKFGKAKTLVVYADSAYGAISNLILSDTEIDPKEQVVILPVAATETTMAAGENGEYIADADGQIILQAIDTESLIRDYGADTLIKGIAVIGNPACRTAEGLSNLTAIQSDGAAITEYGTKTAPQGTPGVVADGHALSLKISEIADYKFGWKAGAS